MTVRMRHFGILATLAIIATVAAWISRLIPVIYLMPLFVLQGVMLSLACPRCDMSPFVRKIGPFRVGWPIPASTCAKCGFPIRDFRGS